MGTNQWTVVVDTDVIVKDMDDNN